MDVIIAEICTFKWAAWLAQHWNGMKKNKTNIRHGADVGKRVGSVFGDGACTRVSVTKSFRYLPTING